MLCTRFASPRGQAGALGSSGLHNCPDPGSAGGVYMIPGLSYEDASTRERITDKAKRINSAMQMLIALPLFSLKADDCDESGGTALALVALEALKRTDVDWDSILQRYTLSFSNQHCLNSSQSCTA